MQKDPSKGLIIAGLFNILGVLAFTKGFQDLTLGNYFPELFSAWGLGGIILWGFAYLSLSSTYRAAPAILLVFAIEKFFYFGSWVWWQWNHFARLPEIWSEHPQAAVFYSVYGPGDLAFGMFFLSLFFVAKRSQGSNNHLD